MEEPSSEPRESSPANLVALKTQATALRDQIYRLEREEEFKSGGGRRASSSSTSNGTGSVTRQSKATEKPRKKLAEVEAQLLLASPGLVFQVRRGTDNDAQRRRWARLKAKGERSGEKCREKPLQFSMRGFVAGSTRLRNPGRGIHTTSLGSASMKQV